MKDCLRQCVFTTCALRSDIISGASDLSLDTFAPAALHQAASLASSNSKCYTTFESNDIPGKGGGKGEGMGEEWGYILTPQP